MKLIKTCWSLTMLLLHKNNYKKIQVQQRNKSCGLFTFTPLWHTNDHEKSWDDSISSKQRNQRIQRRAGPGGASGHHRGPQMQPGTGMYPRQWPLQPPWCWRPGRTISPRLPLQSAAGSPAMKEEKQNNADYTKEYVHIKQIKPSLQSA